MKKNSLLLVSFLLILETTAQITITSVDIAKPMQSLYSVTDKSPTISIGTAGVNKIWDMSALNTHTVDTIVFLTPSSTPFMSNFPTANLAYQKNTDTNYTYLTNSTTGLLLNGIKENTSVTNYFPPKTIISLPLTYGTNFISNYVEEFEATTPGKDLLRNKSEVVKTSVADAWGNIQNPQGNFDCLRMSEKMHHRDSVFVKFSGTWHFIGTSTDSSKIYTWWTNKVGFPLLTANVNYLTDSLEEVSWTKFPVSVGLKDPVAVFKVKAYPNPAQNEVQFKGDIAPIGNLKIYDIAGKMVYAAVVQGNATTISITDFVNGTYLYTITDDSTGNVINSGKFNVIK